MAHQTVEIERRGNAGVDLVIRDFRFDAHSRCDLARRLGGSFQRAAFGHVENNLELALVVEGQHFDFYKPDSYERHGNQQQANDAAQKTITPSRPRNQWTHEPAVKPRKKSLGTGPRSEGRLAY